MCLDPKENKAYRLKKKMTVYKTAMLMEPDKKGEVILSVFQAFRYIPGKKYRCKEFKKEVCDMCKVYHGFHSYRTYGGALLNAITGMSRPDIILRCEVPAGSWIYQSKDSIKWCSDRIWVTGWRVYDKQKREWENGWRTPEPSVFAEIARGIRKKLSGLWPFS